MKLANFDVISEVELKSGDTVWELHNFANFNGLELIRSDDSVVMNWSAPNTDNPWGYLSNKASAMRLYFRGLKFLHVGPRDPELPMTEDECLANMFKVDSANWSVDPSLRTLALRDAGDSFRLLFEFQSGRRIEIESETVELISIP